MLPAGGVFEEAVAIASLLLDPSDPIAETVRNEQVSSPNWRVSRACVERGAGWRLAVIVARWHMPGPAHAAGAPAASPPSHLFA